MTTPTAPAAAWPVLEAEPASLLATVLGRHARVLLFGPPGVGKSTLAAGLCRGLAADSRACRCIGADPGSPAFGIPGAVSLAEWRDGNWRVVSREALCTLDAGRFRLPLVEAVRRMAGKVSEGILLVDAPGVVRGAAGSELLSGLAEAANVDAVLALSAAGRVPPLMGELRNLARPVYIVQAHPSARSPGRGQRARERTARWDAHLAKAVEQRFDLAALACGGTPPPRGVTSAWVGRQVALQRGAQTLSLGEVLRLEGDTLLARVVSRVGGATGLLVRDAARNALGLIATAAPFAPERVEYVASPVATGAAEGGPCIVTRVGALDVTLVNGVFGDPLLHLRLRYQGRGLLFELGGGGRLSARVAHQLTDVFISHAHIDHIGGFLWLLRSRIGEFPPCRLYGPPGLARNIAGMMDGILWDRVGERAPSFEVAELRGDVLCRFALRAGRTAVEALEERPATDGVLLKETGFRVRAATLDHGTPVLAFAFEPDAQLNIRKDRLSARGLAPGPWLGELKRHALSGNETALIELPDGTTATVAELAAELVLVTPGKKLVYATDLADTTENRARLIGLARHAHTFFCEAPFLEADRERAQCTGHLTARACGEIADAAEVARLVPFHFSRRYAGSPGRVYAEVAAACSRMAAPGAFEAASTY